MSWTYNNKEINSIDDMKPHIDGKPWGFVYMLTLVDKKTKKIKYQYIGKKNLYSITSKTATKKEFEANAKSYFQRKKMKNGTWKYYTTVIKESNWRDYLSSNLYIKKNSSKYDIVKEILLFSTNDSELTYLEAKEIICQGALETDHFLNDGVSIRRYGKKIIN
jgi:hypothetical protein